MYKNKTNTQIPCKEKYFMEDTTTWTFTLRKETTIHWLLQLMAINTKTEGRNKQTDSHLK